MADSPIMLIERTFKHHRVLYLWFPLSPKTFPAWEAHVDKHCPGLGVTSFMHIECKQSRKEYENLDEFYDAVNLYARLLISFGTGEHGVLTREAKIVRKVRPCNPCNPCTAHATHAAHATCTRSTRLLTPRCTGDRSVRKGVAAGGDAPAPASASAGGQ